MNNQNKPTIPQPTINGQPVPANQQYGPVPNPSAVAPMPAPPSPFGQPPSPFGGFGMPPASPFGPPSPYGAGPPPGFGAPMPPFPPRFAQTDADIDEEELDLAQMWTDSQDDFDFE